MLSLPYYLHVMEEVIPIALLGFVRILSDNVKRLQDIRKAPINYFEQWDRYPDFGSPFCVPQISTVPLTE